MTVLAQKVALYALPCDNHFQDRADADNSSLFGRIGEQMPGILWTTDADLRFTLVQGAGLAQLGLQPDDMVGLTVGEFFKSDDATFSPLAAHHAALVGLAQNFEFTVADRAYFGCAEPFFAEDGSLLGTIAVIQDASGRRQAEEKRLRSVAKNQEEKAAESLRTLARAVAHNFNNLLTAVIGYASLAAKELPAGSPANAFIERLESAARAAADISGRMGAYGGNMMLREEPLSMSAVVQKSVDRLQETLPGNVRLQCDLAQNVPFIHADSGRLGQVVDGLLANASEAIGGKEGTICVRTRVAFADRPFLARMFPNDNLAEGDYIWLQVLDTGCGMSGETTARAFEPFFSTKFIGRGLGLATAQAVVRSHQGAITIAGKPGLGTTVHMLLPVATNHKPAPLAGPHKAPEAFGDLPRLDDHADF